MKIAWLLAIFMWLSSSGDGSAQLQFATEESLDEIQEDEIHILTPVHMETSPGVPLRTDRAATWNLAFYQLLISCDHGTLQLDREVEQSLVDTTFLCVNGSVKNRLIGAVTTAQEAQQILSSIIYQPELNYHSTWFGVTDPICLTGNDGNEIGADNFNGLAFVLVEISDLGNYGEGGTLRSVFVLCVKVEIRDNEPPTISIASTFYAPTGEWVALAGIEITDPDSVEGILYVSLAVHNGKLRVTLSPRVNSVGPTALHSTVDGAIAQKLEFATTAEQANEIFQTLEYRCDDDNGCSKSLRDYLRVHVDDNGFTGAGGSQVATKRAEIVVA
ncbi:hypothetical protein JG688_00008539 [Phytophthora aleatoria]|uniref:Uncharacterized protein n=1 Tax=Phytophthora aleatoria TaxID=2496075 RepID=A0A8J5MG57_9STRA|nr:hypothetical protein JG688_00008539 [Phytophthora aleatoria]